MLAQEVAQKYARALFASTKDRNSLDAVYGQLTDLNEYVEKDKSLMDYLNSPNVYENKKIDLLRTVFLEKLNRIVVEFLIVLVEKKRIGFLPIIIDEYIRLVESEKGIARVTAIVAMPLKEEERNKLVQKLSEKTNMKIKLEVTQDPSIIGGMIVVMHNNIIDGSIKHQLELVTEKMSSVRVH